MATRQAPSGEPLRGFLEDWRIHLRAKNRSRGTIESYLTVGTALCDWLDAQGRPGDHTAINRLSLETYLVDMHRGSRRPPWRSTTAPSSSSFDGL